MGRHKKCVDIFGRQIRVGDCLAYINTTASTQRSSLDICEVLEITPKASVKMVPLFGDKRIILRTALRAMKIFPEDLPEDSYFDLQANKNYIFNGEKNAK